MSEKILSIIDYGFCVKIKPEDNFDKKSKEYKLDVIEEVMSELEDFYYKTREDK